MFLFDVYVEQVYGNFFMLLWIGYVGMPMLDFLIPVDHSNLSENRARKFEKDSRFLIPLYTVFIFDFWMYFWLMFRISRGEVGSSFGELALYSVIAAHVGMVDVVVGHELFHRRERINKICGTLVYAKIFYGHFFISHLRHHHKYVATSADTSTARLGESLHAFVARTIP